MNRLKNMNTLVLIGLMFVTTLTSIVSETMIYTGSARGFKSTIEVEVTVEDENITEVEVTSHRDDRRWFERAYKVIPSAIIEAQSTDVDTVSGATYSSKGIINAVKDALSE